MSSNAPNALIARLKQPSGPPNAVIAKGRKKRGKTPNAIVALSGPVLRDTARLSQRYPPIARNMANWVRYPLPLVWAFPPLESMRSGGAIPPLKRGISAILARYPVKTRQMGAIPPSAIVSRKGITRYGGVSRTGPLSCRLEKKSLTSLFEKVRVVKEGHMNTGPGEPHLLQDESRKRIALRAPQPATDQERPNAERGHVERGFAAQPPEKWFMRPPTPTSALLTYLFLHVAKSAQKSLLGGHCKITKTEVCTTEVWPDLNRAPRC